MHNFGPAIPAQLLPHLFEPLRRGEQQVKLGSRGQVAVESSKEQGTTFQVTLPRE